MNAFLFPGQGSQSVEWDEFYKNFTIVKQIFNEANEILKFNLSKLILKGQKVI